jgi:NADPH:quinone reductase-like Zn-dependent oxidoreductase
MKAIVSKRAGSPDRLLLTDVPKPVPEPNEVLVRIHAASVTRGDVVMRKMPRLVARLFGETPKSIPGYEFAGEVEASGGNVVEFEVGDRVFGTTSGLTQGSYAEYICVPEDGVITHIPPNVGYEEAAPIPVGAMAALHFLQAGDVGSHKRVLVNGASGSVGSYAIQIAKKIGAYVIGVASTSNEELVTSLGADEVVDYTKQDFTEGTEKYDVIFDAVGKTTAKEIEGVLAENGRFVTTRTRRREKAEELRAVRDMVANGAVKAQIDRSYTLDQISVAHRYVEEGRKRGNVVIVIGSSEEAQGVE